jgi:hypothetical protein
MRAAGKTAFVMLALVATALAQGRRDAGPAPAAFGSTFAVSVGYSYLYMPMPSAGHVNLNGIDAGAYADFTPRWGATIDTGFVRASNVLGTGHIGYVLSALVGPEFTPLQSRNSRMFLHLLGGAGVVDGAVPTSGSARYLRGWVERFSYAAGGGMERTLSGPFAVRVGGDYLHTTFIDSSAIRHPQNNLRAAVSLVFHFGENQR